MTQDELKKKIELELARNRAAVERSEAFSREFGQFAAIHTVRMEQAFRELRESVRRR